MISLVEFICGIITGYNRKKKAIKRLRRDSDISYMEAVAQVGLYLSQYKMCFKALRVHLVTTMLWRAIAYTGLLSVALLTVIVVTTDLTPIVWLVIAGLGGVIGSINALRTGVLIDKELTLIEHLEKLV